MLGILSGELAKRQQTLLFATVGIPKVELLKINEQFLGIHDLDQIPSRFVTGQLVPQGVEHLQRPQPVDLSGRTISVGVKCTQHIAGTGVVTVTGRIPDERIVGSIRVINTGIIPNEGIVAAFSIVIAGIASEERVFIADRIFVTGVTPNEDV